MNSKVVEPLKQIVLIREQSAWLVTERGAQKYRCTILGRSIKKLRNHFPRAWLDIFSDETGCCVVEDYQRNLELKSVMENLNFEGLRGPMIFVNTAFFMPPDATPRKNRNTVCPKIYQVTCFESFLRFMKLVMSWRTSARRSTTTPWAAAPEPNLSGHTVRPTLCREGQLKDILKHIT